MPSPVMPNALHRQPSRAAERPCPAINDRAPDLVVCSLRAGDHDIHQLRCEDTGELLGEWTDADMTFREPTSEFQRYIEFSDRPVHEIHYGDVA